MQWFKLKIQPLQMSQQLLRTDASTTIPLPTPMEIPALTTTMPIRINVETMTLILLSPPMYAALALELLRLKRPQLKRHLS